VSKLTFKKEPTRDSDDTAVITYEFTEVDIHQVMVEFRAFLLAIGFCEKTVDEYLGDLL